MAFLLVFHQLSEVRLTGSLLNLASEPRWLCSGYSACSPVCGDRPALPKPLSAYPSRLPERGFTLTHETGLGAWDREPCPAETVCVKGFVGSSTPIDSWHKQSGAGFTRVRSPGTRP